MRNLMMIIALVSTLFTMTQCSHQYGCPGSGFGMENPLEKENTYVQVETNAGVYLLQKEE